MTHSTELRFGSIFLGSLVFVASSLVATTFKFSASNMAYLLSQCQPVVTFITSSQNLFGSGVMVLVLGLVSTLLLKSLIARYKTYIREQTLSQKKLPVVPLKVARICTKHDIPKSELFVIPMAKPVAVTIGFRKPRVVLSTNLINRLTANELEAVILHERYHQQNRHGLWLVIGEVVSATLIFILPTLKDVLRTMQLRFESAADLFAVETQGTSKYLLQALNKLDHSGTTLAWQPGFASFVSQRRQAFATQSRNKQVHWKNSHLLMSGVGSAVLFFLTVTPTKTLALTEELVGSAKCTPFSQCAVQCTKPTQPSMTTVDTNASQLR